jgi:phosphate transport system substrate-binding protein
MLLLLCTLALSGCASPEAEAPPKDVPEPPITAENFPRLDASTSAEPVLAQIACKFAGVPCRWMDWLDGERRLVPDLTAYAEGFPEYSASGTHQAYLNLIDGQADLIVVARPPSEDENRRAAATGRHLELHAIALDAFVFIVDQDNPVEGLSTQDIRNIYTGRLTNWSEVGGQDAEIHPYQRDENSGSQELMRTLVMRELPMVDAPDLIMLTMFAPFYAVSTDPVGIGYSIYFYEENMAPEKESVRLLAVDGVMPGADSIRSRQYPYTTEVYAVVRGDLPDDSLARQLLDWLRSPAGQALIQDCGYVPLQGK